jgi:hypothetical protein
MAHQYEEVYYVGLLDDIHNFFPAILYHPRRFTTFQDLTTYIQDQMNQQFNTFNRARRAYHEQHGIRIPVQNNMNIFTPGLAPTPAHRPRVAVGLTTETFDLTHLFTTGGGLGARIPGGDLEEFPIGVGAAAGGGGAGGGILDQLANLLTRAAEPVVVAPTPQQIERATTIRVPYSTEETEQIERATNIRVPYSTEEMEHTACAICQDPLMAETEVRPLREITHCEHIFHQTCIDRWFTRNVRCPVCRFDIREHESPENSP